MAGAERKTPSTSILQFGDGAALLHNVLESAAVGTVLVDGEGRITYANRAFCEMLGYRREEAIGRRLRDSIHSDDAAASALQVAKLRAGDIESYRTERRYRRKDGTTMWVLVSASALRDEQSDAVAQVIVQVTDIDRQKRAEEALGESESRWNFALESAGQGVWDHDLENNQFFYSRMWRMMRGIGPEEEVDGTLSVWIKNVHPDDQERILEIIAKQDSGEIDFNAFEYRERHRLTGQWIWILSRGRPVRWMTDGKTPARIMGTDTDITSLKRAEAQLAKEKELLRVTLHSIGDGVISTDADRFITFMNPIAEQMTGWSLAEAKGRRVEQVFTIVDDVSGREAVNPVAECLARRQLYYLNEDVVLLSRSGERRDIRDSAAPVRTPDGALVGAVLVFQDITNSRALQKELAHSALHDGLTGLPNRSAFDRKLVEAGEQARREHREHALCFVDLDRFKHVNDTAGHAAGDALLQEVGNVIRRCTRGQDFAARIGGDEFALLLPDCSLGNARLAAQQVVDAIASMRFVWHGKTYRIGASVGITAISYASPRSAGLMSEADTACYAAKASGRNQVAVYDPTQAPSRRFQRSA